MFKGTVLSIHIAPTAEAAMQSVEEVRAISGKGLEGDRYFNQTGTFSKPQPDRELTLIESEAVDALKAELGVDLEAGSIRRNIVTRGVPLNHLVGREFRLGEIKVRGIRLCEPCAHLAQLAHSAVLPGLVHRAGLRAQILTDGTIRVGETVTQ